MENIWDQKFSSESYLYGELPNPGFKSFISSNKPGKILLPGEGEGRNAVFAAQQGWDVYAADKSMVAMRKAKMLSEKYGVNFNYALGDLMEQDYALESFDVIAPIFFHLNPEIRIQLHQFFVSLLKPGGKLYVLGFSTEQLNYSSGGPKDKNMLYSESKLAEDFKELQVIKNIRIETSLEEGEGHEGPASLIEFEALKPL
ncbi:class I SAM-dependent methyltransferase [Labilibacter sediminis]|nr:class I SAM-dependent methyltransferase [Labilibacter sediminis]